MKVFLHRLARRVPPNLLLPEMFLDHGRDCLLVSLSVTWEREIGQGYKFWHFRSRRRVNKNTHTTDLICIHKSGIINLRTLLLTFLALVHQYIKDHCDDVKLYIVCIMSTIRLLCIIKGLIVYLLVSY